MTSIVGVATLKPLSINEACLQFSTSLSGAAEIRASVSAYQHEAEQFLVHQLTDSGRPNTHTERM